MSYQVGCLCITESFGQAYYLRRFCPCSRYEGSGIMQLSVVRQMYNGIDAAELAYSKRTYFMGYIRNQLKLKHINEAYIREYVEDVLHSGIELLLSSRYDCANADEAIVEAMSRAVQNAVRELSRRKETPDTLLYRDSKDGDKEVSRIDLQGGCVSAEQVLIDQEDECTLEQALELAESVRYNYGFDVILNLLLRAGTVKGMWSTSAANGLLIAFESAIPARKYLGDTCIARVVSAAASAEPDDLIQAMRRNLSRCDVMLSALGYEGS